MILQELITRFQALGNDGWAMHKVWFQHKDIGGVYIEPEELNIIFKSEATVDGKVTVNLGGDK